MENNAIQSCGWDYNIRQVTRIFLLAFLFEKGRFYLKILLKIEWFYMWDQGKTDCFKTGKRVQQGYIWSLCLFSFNVEYIIGNARLGESQIRIKIVGRNINNLRYADDTTLKAENESKEELNSLLMKVKEENVKAVFLKKM